MASDWAVFAREDRSPAPEVTVADEANAGVAPIGADVATIGISGPGEVPGDKDGSVGMLLLAELDRSVLFIVSSHRRRWQPLPTPLRAARRGSHSPCRIHDCEVNERNATRFHQDNIFEDLLGYSRGPASPYQVRRSETTIAAR